MILKAFLNFPIFAKRRSTTAKVCEASSRVGESMTRKRRFACAHDLRRRSRAGTTKASVFPEPVTASHSTSLLPMKSGIA